MKPVLGVLHIIRRSQSVEGKGKADLSLNLGTRDYKLIL